MGTDPYHEKHRTLPTCFAICLQEVKTLLAMLYTQFTFKYACSEPEGQAYRITSYPKNGVPVTVHSRKRK